MNNYFELIYLNEELNEKLEGTYFDVAISPHKDVVEIFLDTLSEPLRLIFSANPTETALFVDSYRPPKKSNVIEFFKGVEGKKIVNVELAHYDRLVYLNFEDQDHLLFKLFSSKPNIFLVRDGEIVESFKNPGEKVGQPPPEPYAPTFSNEVNPKAKPKNQITRLNPLLPRNLIPALVEQHDVADMAPEEVKSFVSWITEELKSNPHPRVLVTGETCLWSKAVLDIETEEAFDTVNNMIRHAYRNAVHTRRLHQARHKVQQMLERALNKRESQLEQLKQADKSLERADEYEKYGHLLMAHAHENRAPDQQQIEVEDLYNQSQTVTIPLKDQKDLAENAQHYYEKAKESRTSYEKAMERISGVEQEIGELKKLLDEMEEFERLYELEKWIKDRDETLEKYGYGTGDQDQAQSPFRKFKVGKYEVWIGKSAKSNDKLTSLAHKEDVWLHARGVPGSHTVIRMGNQKEFPPKNIILQAASYAAYYSKARGMKTAPVMYTKVKYVRSPKGSPPGAVVVEREEVEMVPPQKPNH
ncbi:NFACT RNA binding domain-containing protein [Halalkalibaculum sp. DA3122]|uniref:NFACT RNA binding domain-containing protein n=1 Tax=unclassified Halalkalibaculum TaxID=2964617 RepID=UPI0037543971